MCNASKNAWLQDDADYPDDRQLPRQDMSWESEPSLARPLQLPAGIDPAHRQEAPRSQDRMNAAFALPAKIPTPPLGLWREPELVAHPLQASTEAPSRGHARHRLIL